MQIIIIYARDETKETKINATLLSNDGKHKFRLRNGPRETNPYGEQMKELVLSYI